MGRVTSRLTCMLETATTDEKRRLDASQLLLLRSQQSSGEAFRGGGSVGGQGPRR